MKHLPPKTVMTRLNIIVTDEGYELESPAGTAKYDAWGARSEVNGIPEYFPASVSVENRESAKPGAKYSSGLSMAIESGDANKVIELIDEHIRESFCFKDIAPQPVEVTCNINIEERLDGNVKAIIENAMRNNAQVAAFESSMKSTVRRILLMELRPGGILHERINRR